MNNFIENADSNYDQGEGENLKTKVQKKSKDQKLDEVLKTPKETKVSKTTSNVPKTEPPKRTTRGRPAAAKLNLSFDETKVRKTVNVPQVNNFL